MNSNYVLYVKRTWPTATFSFVDSNNNVVLERTYDCNAESALVNYRNFMLEIQSTLPKGKKISLEVIQVEDTVQ
jgi:hypothetical protein